MLELENLAQNGAEGGISVGRLANLKGINNPELQELADIAAQFVKTRESNHGAAQRAFAGMGAAGIGSMVGGPVGALAGLGGSMAAGRAANGLLNSQALKNSLLRAPGTEATNALAAPVYRSAPRAGSLDTSRR
jgi:GH24 family phage-related lysozyme (muramidase)